MIYDGESREKLLEAYSNEAVFSFSACPGGPRYVDKNFDHGVYLFATFVVCDTTHVYTVL